MTWLARLFRGWILDQAVRMIAARLKQDKALVYALNDYYLGAAFTHIIRTYAANTKIPDDDKVIPAVDQIIEELQIRPFRDFLGQYLAGITLPDFDGDPENDISVKDALDKIIEETLK